jgi:AcrR family transcriptional regulator
MAGTSARKKAPASASKRVLPPEVRKAQLLTAARQVMAESGFSKMRVSDIVAAAGLSQGAFYLHFSGKDDVVVELIRAMVAEAAATLHAVDIEKLNMEDGVRAILRGYYKTCFAYRDVLDNIDSGTSTGIDRDLWNKAFEPLNSFATRAISEWQKRGEVKAKNADQLSWLFIDMINGALPRLFGHSRKRISADYEDRIGDWLIAALRGYPENK